MSRGMKYATAAGVVAVVGMMGMMMVAIAVLGYMVYKGQNAPAPAPTPVVVASEITTILDAHDEDARRLAALHTAIADALEQDINGAIKTTEDVRQVNTIAGSLCLGSEFKGKHPGLSDACNKVVTGAIGLENRTLTPDLRTKAVEAFRAIAAAEAKAAE